jgi:hypothetical protein
MLKETIDSSFKSTQSANKESMLNICTYLLKNINYCAIPKGISIVVILFECGKLARSCQAYRTARLVLNILRDRFILPLSIRDEFELQLIEIQVSSNFLFRLCSKSN